MIPSVDDICKENPNRVKAFVDAGLKKFSDDHLFRYGQKPKPGNKYELCSWSFMNRDALSKELEEEVLQELTYELELLGYKVAHGEYLHKNIYDQVYDKSPTLLIEIPLKGSGEKV